MITTAFSIDDALSRFGLSDAEIAVYRALLSFGSQPASVIASKAKLKRDHTYNVLSGLREIGLVQEFVRDDVTHFTGADPQILLSILGRRKDELEEQKASLLQIIPLLSCLRHPLASPPKVRLFTGVEGIKEIYNDTVRHADGVIHAVVDFAHCFPKENSKELNDWMWKYCSRRAKKGIVYRGIANKSPDSDIAYRKRKEQKRELKMLTCVDLSVELNIYGNRTALISSSHDMVGLIIEDQPIADTLRNLHGAVWGLLPGYR